MAYSDQSTLSDLRENVALNGDIHMQHGSIFFFFFKGCQVHADFCCIGQNLICSMLSTAKQNTHTHKNKFHFCLNTLPLAAAFSSGEIGLLS